MISEDIIDHQPSIDWQLCVKLANNNKELAKDLLEMFVADLPRASDAIHHAYEQRNNLELVNQVHRLHGASCYCGVSKMKNILARMEFTAREKQFSQFEQSLNDFDTEVNNILSAYKMTDFV